MVSPIYAMGRGGRIKGPHVLSLVLSSSSSTGISQINSSALNQMLIRLGHEVQQSVESMDKANAAGFAAGRAEHPDVYFSPSYLDLDDSMARDIMLPEEEHRTLCKFSMELRNWENVGCIF
jgi:hypothetical protein